MKCIKRILRKTETWLYIYLILIVSFAIIYRVIPSKNFNFSDNHNIINCFYLSVVSITTLGFGDVLPITDLGKLLVTTEVILGVISIGCFFNFLSIKLSENIELERIKEREIKELPLRKIVYEEVQWFVWFFNFQWLNAYRKVCGDKCADGETITLQKLFTKHEFEKITNNLDIFSYTSEETKHENWGGCLYKAIDSCHRQGSEILLKHLTRIDPDLYLLIDKFSNKDSFFHLMAVDIENGLNTRPTSKLLKFCGIVPYDHYFESILKLINWCDEEYEKLKPKTVDLSEPIGLKKEYKIKTK